ncbi:MAG: peptidoglycan bridge formation glycyltransferase FemA/FemB family protein, partial [Chloroflexi bacterium]
MNEIFAWNNLIANLPNPHFLQTYEWGQVKAKVGWQPLYLTWFDAGFSAQTELSNLQPATVKAAALVLKKNVLSRGFAARLCVLYSPKGPLMDWGDESLRKRVLDDLQGFARKQGAIFLKLDPDVVLGTGIPLRGTFPGGEADLTEPGGEAVRADLSARGWRFSEEQIQFRNTVTLDVATSEEEMLSRMKQKTRYNVRLGAKKGVSVRVGGEADWPMLYKMYAETSVRDGFVIRDEGYYRTVWESFRCQVSGTRLEPLAEPLVAEVNG